MWVLSTARAELHYFPDSAAIPGGYAILSHTWTQDPAGEQTLLNVQDIIKECKNTGRNPRDYVGEKIRRSCKIAERDGYDWIWIDSCCIDKTSSTEVSEAINSMINWYTLAEVCYVFLEDVYYRGNSQAEEFKAEFQRARWHTRGWTLQELLAPAFVVFLSCEWIQVGTKHDLCIPLSQCTGIDTEFLLREYDFLGATIAERMSWATKRKTTRVEDEAYCLLGLFGLSMPTLYGEGRQAFQRLQTELVKQTVDTTLFAWGNWHDSGNDKEEQQPLAGVYATCHNPDASFPSFLFSPSPGEFIGLSNVRYTPHVSPQYVLQPYLPSQGSDEVRVVR